MAAEILRQALTESDKFEMQRCYGVEHLIEYENGATLLLRGYDCPFCNNFVNRKSGKQNFCHKCGADLREEATDDTENK